jgi:hypothetical protein
MTKTQKLALGLSLLAVAMVGGTSAFFTASERTHNIITTSGVSIELIEDTEETGVDGRPIPFTNIEDAMPGDRISKIPKIKNIDETDIYVRMKVTASVELETGEKVVKVVDEVDVNYIACQAHGQFGISDTFDGVTDGYTFRAVLKSSTEYFENENLGEHVTYLAGSPEINMKAGTLGYNGTSEKLNYAFADDTEYTIEYIVDGNTTVKVNGVVQYPEVRFGGKPTAFACYGCDVNSTVKYGVNTKDKAIIGDFKNAFKWGYAANMPLEIIEYGDPDG